jgi:glycerol-3-phosphate cytidylyltransferase
MRIGFTCSTFDLFHAGHVLMLQEAKSVCDYLIVGLQSDPSIDRGYKNKPILSVFEREIMLSSCKYVDQIVHYNYEDDLLNLLKTLPINIRILGEEYKGLEFTGKTYCEKNCIKMYFNKRHHNFSSSNIRKRIKDIL